MNYDIFISYKRKSLPTANNLYYRLTTRGYSTFFDLEEMGRDDFNVQLLNYIENAKDVFVLLEEGSLEGCKQENWEEEDWFCREIAFALEKKKNIIPILIGGYKMPSQEFFPDRLKELTFKNAPEFNFSFFEAYLDKLIEKDYILSKPDMQEKATSVFKFYSNENCQIFKEGKLVCSLEGMSDEPYYLSVPRKGDYRFKCINSITAASQILKEHIDVDEERDVNIHWEEHKPFIPEQECPVAKKINGEIVVDLGDEKLKMIKVSGGEFDLWSFNGQKATVSDFWISEFVVTNKLWMTVFGLSSADNQKSHKLPKEFKSIEDCIDFINKLNWITDGIRPSGTLFRFPTEVEWEYAARGGVNQDKYLYAGSNKAENVAWFFSFQKSSKGYHPVGKKSPNSLGLYDMSGNINELSVKRERIELYFSDYRDSKDYFLMFPIYSMFTMRGGSCAQTQQCCLIKYTTPLISEFQHLGIRLVLSDIRCCLANHVY